MQDSQKAKIKEIIEDYKNNIFKKHFKEEIYKWELLNQFEGRPDTDAINFDQEINAMNFGNLIYPIAYGVLKKISKSKPEELRDLFKALFNEKNNLFERIKIFRRDVLKLYRSVNGEHNSHQDERSIATYLTFKYPQKYTFYQAKVYGLLCNDIGEKKASVNKRYIHYLSLLDYFVSLIKEDDIVELTREQVPNGKIFNLRLLAQNIVFSYYSKNTENTNYWIFQGNPKVHDFKTAIKEGTLNDWTVTSHKDKIKVGDKVIMWIAGKEAGCYGLAQITYNPKKQGDSEGSSSGSDKKDGELKAGIRITHNLIDAPILKHQIEGVEELRNLKVGAQGSNFSATKNQYEALFKIIEKMDSKLKYWLYAPGQNASKWEEFYEKGILALGWDELGDLNQYKDKEEIAKRLQEIHQTKSSKKNDATANYEIVHEMSIGDVVIAKKGRSDYLGYGIVASDYYYDSERADYRSVRKVEWKKKGIWKEDNHPIVLKTLTDITKYPEYVDRLKKLIGIEQLDLKEGNKQLPKNTILYGPPGTGKTYSLKNDFYDEYTSRETSLSKEEFFEEVVRDLTWWQVIGLALLEANEVKVSEILTNRWVSKKADLSESKNVRATIWGTLQMHTVEESETVLYKQRQMPLIFDKNKDKSWKILKSELEEQAPELYEIRDKVNNFNPQSDKLIKRYVFTTFHQSFSYEDFIEGIKPVISDVESDTEGSVSYHIEDGIFKKLCKRAVSDPDHRYAIFIDEINRGNVSAIFGELISLIEPDKRKGQENELVAELPYSKKEFSVPSNVDIYGTMNTADRSVEALDTALRRRFSFLEYMPKPELLADKGENGNGTVAGINLVKLLSTINDRIEVLIDRDHTIGHAYFMSVKNIKDLRSVFKNRIIPLLQEYFYGDYAKMEMVIGPDFFEKKAIPEVKFATEAVDYQLEGFVYHIRNPEAEDFDMEKALKRLLNKDNEE